MCCPLGVDGPPPCQHQEDGLALSHPDCVFVTTDRALLGCTQYENTTTTTAATRNQIGTYETKRLRYYTTFEVDKIRGLQSLGMFNEKGWDHVVAFPWSFLYLLVAEVAYMVDFLALSLLLQCLIPCCVLDDWRVSLRYLVEYQRITDEVQIKPKPPFLK